MTTQSHLPGLRPALSGLPPTLQPHAVLAFAPPTDRRRSAAAAAAIYAVLGGGVAWLAHAGPAVLAPKPLPLNTTVILEPGPRVAAPTRTASPARPTDPVPPVKAVAIPQAIPPTPAALPTQDVSSQPPALPQPAAEGPAIGSAGGGPIQLSADAVRVLRQVDPVYPPLAMAAHLQGQVVVHMVIDPQGIPEEVDAVSGPEAFRGPALAAARQWRFAPATEEGQPVPAAFLLTLKFVLR